MVPCFVIYALFMTWSRGSGLIPHRMSGRLGPGARAGLFVKAMTKQLLSRTRLPQGRHLHCTVELCYGFKLETEAINAASEHFFGALATEMCFKQKLLMGLRWLGLLVASSR